MNRRVALFTAAPLRGRPWKKHDTPIAIHQSQRPPEIAFINFDELELTHKLTHSTELKVPRIGWSPKPETSPNLPFLVERSHVGHLPVYTEFKAGRTKVVTQLRKIRGDVDSLRKDMEKVVGKPVKIMPGKLQVDGNFALRLKIWLTGLGF